MSNGIGNIEHARQIFAWLEDDPRDSLWDIGVRTRNRIAPGGWSYLSRGSFRSAWVSPDGVVYKVSHDTYSSRRENGRERDNLVNAWHRGAPEGCRLPRWSAFDVGGDGLVLAMELIKGRLLVDLRAEEGSERLYKLRSACEIKFNLMDLHGHNLIVEEGTGLLVPIDFGG